MKNISDNPSYQEMAEQIQGMLSLSSLCPKLLDEEYSEQLRNLQAELEKLRHLPDEFNKYYAPLGWIAYENMHAPLLEKCVRYAQAGRTDDREKALVAHYNGDMGHLISQLKHIEGFKERYGLFQKAYADFKDGRYHSCIPLFLMIMDGAVDQVVKSNKGFFAQGTNLSLWDSIVGHDSGLVELARIFGAARKKTNHEPLTIPYRNGIMHGKDINYDNILVATKSLAAVFAIANWAQQFGSEKHNRPAKKPQKNLIRLLKDCAQIIKEIKEIKKAHRHIEEWAPRNFDQVDFAAYEIPLDSPEKKIIDFLELWKKENYGGIASLLTNLPDKSISQIAGEARTCLEGKSVEHYTIIGINDRAPAVTDIQVRLSVKTANDSIVQTLNCKCFFQSDRTGTQPLVRGNPNGAWYISGIVLRDIENMEYIDAITRYREMA